MARIVAILLALGVLFATSDAGVQRIKLQKKKPTALELQRGAMKSRPYLKSFSNGADVVPLDNFMDAQVDDGA